MLNRFRNPKIYVAMNLLMDAIMLNEMSMHQPVTNKFQSMIQFGKIQKQFSYLVNRKVYLYIHNIHISSKFQICSREMKIAMNKEKYKYFKAFYLNDDTNLKEE